MCPAAVRGVSAGDTGPGRKVWATLSDLGVDGLAVAERFDGIEATLLTWWWPPNDWATGVCPAP